MKTISKERLLPVGFTLAITIIAHAQTVPPPFLAVAPTNGTQLLITVTNGVPYANYSLFTTPVLNDDGYPWTLVTNAVPGVTNFVVNKGPDIYGFFEVAGGTNWNNNGIPNWDLADPNNPSMGVLTVTIISPAQGAILY